ncbi:sigma-70 family RNA polymerase sigma factor [Streptomyces spectabilis]|uniref:Sigma-70 family RNA polymerase sigma factor n=2 Tax=Streptomyces spectabilis TaxID=68270 RepID=A0A5P2WYH1_STRST|nr:sigma-70 family RNA polymerase sigma factor [Streptomyces spectabilis]
MRGRLSNAMSRSADTGARRRGRLDPGRGAPALSRDDFTDLVCACRGGDERAWAELHARFGPLVRRVVGSYRLQQADVDDVCQHVWSRVCRDLHTLRTALTLRAWLATVARREALRHLGRARRDIPVGGPWEFASVPGDRGDPEESAVAAAECELVRAAVRQLPRQHQELIHLLFADPPVGYDVISEKLGIPRGSIGPMRSRIVGRVRQVMAGERGR